MPPGRLTPYRPRHFAPLGVQTHDGFHVKMYGITAALDGNQDPAEVRRQIVAELPDLVAEAQDLGEHHGHGYAIHHSGMDATWLLFDWWAFGEINCHLLLRADIGCDDFHRVGDRRLNACVWESRVIEHERAAWVRYMLREAPDADGYRGDALPEGAY